TPCNKTELDRFITELQKALPTSATLSAPVVPLYEKICKTAAQSITEIEAWKVENTKLRAYNKDRGAKQPGGRTQLSKAKVLDDSELPSCIKPAEVRVTRAENAKLRKACTAQLARELHLKAMAGRKKKGVESDSEDD